MWIEFDCFLLLYKKPAAMSTLRCLNIGSGTCFHYDNNKNKNNKNNDDDDNNNNNDETNNKNEDNTNNNDKDSIKQSNMRDVSMFLVDSKIFFSIF